MLALGAVAQDQRAVVMVQFPMLILLVIAPFAEKVQQAERQRKAVEAIREAGGHVFYDYEHDLDNGRFYATAIVKVLVRERFFSEVACVYRDYAEFDRVVLEHLGRMTDLKDLRLCDSQITDAGLRHLKGLANLKYLDVTYSTEVTEEGIEELRKALPNCTILGPKSRQVHRPNSPNAKHQP